MIGFLVRLAISALGLWLASELLAGVHVGNTQTLILGALLLGIVNAFVRPLVVVLTLPFTLLSLGAFLWVINAAMLGLVAALLDDFAIAGFWSALGGSLIISFTSWFASWYVGPRGRVEVMVYRR